jgi:hypothetical protein
MNVEPGQGFYLQIPYFGDGETALKPRTFLVISVTHNTVAVLNVSSLVGKESKLLIPSNEKINNFKPPFLMPSFVKLNVIYEIEYFPEIKRAILHNAQRLDDIEFKRILIKLNTYQRSRPLKYRFSVNDIVKCNSRLTKSITS